MERLNRRLVIAVLIFAIVVVAFIVLLNVFPPDDGGIGTLIGRPT